MNKWECNIESYCACPTIFTIFFNHHVLISVESLLSNTHIQIYAYFVMQQIFKTYIFIYIYSIIIFFVF